MGPFKKICVLLKDANRQQVAMAQSLANRFDIPLTDTSPNDYPYHLLYTDNHLELQLNPAIARRKTHPIFSSFIQKGYVSHRLTSVNRRNPLARAAGIKSGQRPSVLDATAGLGGDGMTLAFLGCKVILVERSPVIFALLEDGLLRASQHSELRKVIEENVTLVHGDSIVEVQRLTDQIDTILLDPMYPQSKKSTLQKKEMRFLRDIVGDDVDGEELFHQAYLKAGKRVVVKRPKGAPHITGSPQPEHHITMKSGRFDIYIVPHL